MTMTQHVRERQQESPSMATAERAEGWTFAPALPATSVTSQQEILVLDTAFRRDARRLAWLPELLRRHAELTLREDGWDSYGGSGLSPTVTGQSAALLSQLDEFIRSAPLISLTTDGGLNFEWRSNGVLMQIRMDPGTQPAIYFYDDLVGIEWEGSTVHCGQLPQWLWQASTKL